VSASRYKNRKNISREQRGGEERRMQKSRRGNNATCLWNTCQTGDCTYTAQEA